MSNRFRASHICISAAVCGELLLLAIQGDGCGIRANGSELWGLGIKIKSMGSRAEWLGGELKLLPAAPQGTIVQVVVPMDRGKVK